MRIYYCISGSSESESGGAGTSYVESKSENGTILSQKLIINNNGLEYPRRLEGLNAGPLKNLLDGQYKDISKVGGITWIKHDSSAYKFKELDVSGNAHVAILSDTDNDKIDARIGFLWGDRTGVLHAGKNQTFGLKEVDVYMPTNLAAYK